MRICYSFAICVASFVLASTPLDAEKIGDQACLLRMATQGYALGRNDVAPLSDTEAALKIAKDKNSSLRHLAQLILARDLLVAAKQSGAEGFSANLLEFQDEIRRSLFESAATQSVGEFLGEDLDVLSEMQTIAEGFEGIAARVIGSQSQNYVTARRGWIIEGLICEEVDGILTSQQDAEFDENSNHRFTLAPTSYRSGSRPFAAIRLTSRCDKVLPQAVIILKLDCRYQIPPARKTNTAIGQLLGQSLFGNAMPNYSARDTAREEYANLDKSAVFFVENWRPNQSVELVSLPADEYCGTVQDATILIIGIGDRHEIEVPVTRHQTLLRNRFAPKSSRTRR